MADSPVQLASAERDTVLRSLLPALQRYLRRYCQDPSVAEEVLQETLLRIDRALPGFQGRSRLDTWALAIASRAAADHFRAARREIETVPVEEDDTLLVGGDASLDERLVIDEMNACVREVIDALPSDYRAALILRDLEGYSTEEAAAVLECTAATVKIRLHRARARLQAALGRRCEFYRDRASVLRCERKPGT